MEDVAAIDAEMNSALDDALPAGYAQGFQHLRRFVKPEYLPGRLNETIGYKSPSTSTLCMLIGPVDLISHTTIANVLAQSPNLLDLTDVPHIATTIVPRFAPTTAAQAESWTNQYWPTVWKRNNPFGPHPSILSRAATTLDPARWIAVAADAASAVQTRGLGEAIGAVIVEFDPASSTPDANAVLVAGDARWHALGPQSPPIAEHTRDRQGGNTAAHAAMRAIGMVARKRLAERADGSWSDTTTGPRASIFHDDALTPVEAQYYEAATLARGGYLCVDLTIYLTHEPCVMCSMAIVHSRFSRVVIARRMPRTGAMTADSQEEPGLGYGLFWRKELNWRMLAWEWIRCDDAACARRHPRRDRVVPDGPRTDVVDDGVAEDVHA